MRAAFVVVLALICFCVASVEARKPCEYCEYCEFCSLCENQCPCDHDPNCEYCKYCTYCPLCSLCDTACAEDSYIRSTIDWLDNWKNVALGMIETDEVPDLDQVDQELSKIDQQIKQHKKGRSMLKQKIRDIANDLADLEHEEFGAVLHLVKNMRPEWWGEQKIAIDKSLVEERKHDEL